MVYFCQRMFEMIGFRRLQQLTVYHTQCYFEFSIQALGTLGFLAVACISFIWIMPHWLIFVCGPFKDPFTQFLYFRYTFFTPISALPILVNTSLICISTVYMETVQIPHSLTIKLDFFLLCCCISDNAIVRVCVLLNICMDRCNCYPSWIFLIVW